MPFQYSENAIDRKHSPGGYQSHASYKPWLRDDFCFRCVYCLYREKWHPGGLRDFEVDHFLPVSAHPQKALDYDNLFYACHICNKAKGHWPVPVNLQKDGLGRHLYIHSNGSVQAKTKAGKKVIRMFRLDHPAATAFRKVKMDLYFSGDEISDEYCREFGFPEDLPNLSKLAPPRNEKPKGLVNSYYQKKIDGCLPDFY